MEGCMISRKRKYSLINLLFLQPEELKHELPGNNKALSSKPREEDFGTGNQDLGRSHRKADYMGNGESSNLPRCRRSILATPPFLWEKLARGYYAKIAIDVMDSDMLYIMYGTNKTAEKANAGRRSKKEPDCGTHKGRRVRSARVNRRSREFAGGLLRSRGNQTSNRKTIKTITRMERDWKLLEQQPAPNQAFLLRGTHGY
jgi:hypothetical protein